MAGIRCLRQLLKLEHFGGHAGKLSSTHTFRTLCTVHSNKLCRNINGTTQKSKPFTFHSALVWGTSEVPPSGRFYSTSAGTETGSAKETKNVQDINEPLPATTVHKRLIRRKRTGVQENSQGVYKTRAYSTAEEYDLEGLKSALQQQGIYDVRVLPDDAEDALYVTNKYALKQGEEPREIFFFREGSVVFWNMPRPERAGVLQTILPYQQDSYDTNLAEDESEQMDYVYTETAGSTVSGGRIKLMAPAEGDEVIHLEKYAFSNALSLSVKLGIWEASLEKYVDSMEYVTQDMQVGKKLKISRQEVFKKTGQLYALKHLINLSSDLLDTPDFYWDRESLEDIYMKTRSYLNISRRTKVMNEKLTHCCELTDLLTAHLNDSHHVRLEWMVIILILTEVIIGLQKFF